MFAEVLPPMGHSDTGKVQGHPEVGPILGNFFVQDFFVGQLGLCHSFRVQEAQDTSGPLLLSFLWVRLAWQSEALQPPWFLPPSFHLPWHTHHTFDPSFLSEEAD
jgi:hypothetical protein